VKDSLQNFTIPWGKYVEVGNSDPFHITLIGR